MCFDISKYIGIIGALSGTTLGFILSTLKEHLQNKPKVAANLKTGAFNYYYEHMDSDGYRIQNKTLDSNANLIKLNLAFDVVNIRKIGIGISNVFICLELNKKTTGTNPTISTPFNSKKLVDCSFNLLANSLITINTILNEYRDVNNDFLFEKLSQYNGDGIPPIIVHVLIDTIHKKRVKFTIDAGALHTAF